MQRLLMAHERLKDMKFAVNDLEVMGSNPGCLELGVHSTYM